MKKKDWLIAFGLGLLAAFIWLRDTAWMTSSDDTLPILIALPLFVWLGHPWKWREQDPDYSHILLTCGICSIVLGIGLNIVFLITIGWVCLLYTWLSTRLETSSFDRCKKLLILPIMAFPWVSLDLTQVGWWFRLSGASVASYFFSALGFDVVREGTLLTINHVLISIEVACAGLNTLQSMLIAGSVVAFILLENTPRYWLSIPILIVIAWIANTLRILIICLLALLISPDFVMGSFHTWGAWGVLMLMFFLCWKIFSWLIPKKKL